MKLIDIVLIIIILAVVIWLIYYLFFKKNTSKCGSCNKCKAFSKERFNEIVKDCKEKK